MTQYLPNKHENEIREKMSRMFITKLPLQLIVICSYLSILTITIGVLAATDNAYEISWLIIDTGSTSESSGGEYTLSGTIRQIDASVIENENYSLNGGFWSFLKSIYPNFPIIDFEITINYSREPFSIGSSNTIKPKVPISENKSGAKIGAPRKKRSITIVP